MIIKKRYSFLNSVAGGILLVLSLVGCETPNKTTIPMPDKPYDLKHDTQKFTFHFSKNHKKLSPEEEERFLMVLKPVGPGKISTHLTIPSKKSGAGRHHIKSVVRMALQAGVKPKQIHRSDTLPVATGQSVQVIVDTYRAIPPRCPNWTSAYGKGHGRGPTSNFGCSTASNFLLMIEDPIVLFKGETPSSRDAARDSLAISDHRLGKDKGKWLKTEKADTSSSGSSTPGGSQ